MQEKITKIKTNCRLDKRKLSKGKIHGHTIQMPDNRHFLLEVKIYWYYYSI